jgi:hypothetical protein
LCFSHIFIKVGSGLSFLLIRQRFLNIFGKSQIEIIKSTLEEREKKKRAISFYR